MSFMGSYSWLGPYEDLKDVPKKFNKMCALKVKVDKKVAKDAGKPNNAVLWNFIGNFRDNIIAVGNKYPPVMGYDNSAYMTVFQNLLQSMWKIFFSKFNDVVPIGPLTETRSAGLYDRSCLREQFPSNTRGNAPEYKGGSFEQRQIGGWKWISLILDEENWMSEWKVEKIPKNMTIKDDKMEKIATKYYNSYIRPKNKWSEDVKSVALYGKPHGVKTIPRRYSIPVIVQFNKNDKSFMRYEKFTNIITNKLESQWTLSVWNIISFDHTVSEKKVMLCMKPEINIDLGWIDPKAGGLKEWGEAGEKLHQHHEKVYNVRIGLVNKCKLELPLYIKTKMNPLWDGSANNLEDVIAEPYSRLLDLAISNLSELIGVTEEKIGKKKDEFEVLEEDIDILEEGSILNDTRMLEEENLEKEAEEDDN